MVQGKNADDSGRKRNRLIAVADLFRYIPGKYAVCAGKFAESRAGDTKAQDGDPKINDIVPFFNSLPFADLLFVQKVDQLYPIYPVRVPCPYEKKRGAEEQQRYKRRVGVKPKPENSGFCDRPHDKGCHDAGQQRTGETAYPYGRHSKEEGFTKKMLCHRPLLHAKDHINRKFPAALFQHIVVDISDQRKENDGDRKHGISDRVLKQGQRVISVPVQNIVVAARLG